jgi:hypothetical protein
MPSCSATQAWRASPSAGTSVVARAHGGTVASISLAPRTRCSVPTALAAHDWRASLPGTSVLDATSVLGASVANLRCYHQTAARRPHRPRAPRSPPARSPRDVGDGGRGERCSLSRLSTMADAQVSTMADD